MEYLLKLKRYLFEGNARTVKANKNILYSFGIKGVSIFSQFALVPLTLNYLDSTRYGIWLTLASILGWFSFFDIGVGHGLRNRLAEALAVSDMKKAKILVSTAYALIGITFLSLLILFWLINPFLNWATMLKTPPDLQVELSKVVLLVFTFFTLRFILSLIGSILLANQETALNNLISPLSNIISLAVIYILTQTTSGSLLYVAVTFSAMPVLVFLVMSVILFLGKFRSIAPGIRYVNFSYSKGLLGLGVQYFIIQFAGVILFTSSNFVITQLFGPEQVTVYNIAFRYFSVVNMINGIIMTPFWSAITEAYSKKEYDWIKKTIHNLDLIAIGTVVMAVIMLILAQPLYELWIGTEVHVPFSMNLVMCLYVISTILMTPQNSFINAISKIRLQLITAVVSIIITIPLAILFARTFNMGPAGVVLATCCTTFPTMVMWKIQYNKIINHRAQGIWNK